MKKCELCESPAKIYCESDQASLCWDCDTKVHSANFLVAKHSRTLLCHLCQSPTPWNGSGPKLSPITSVCDVCVGDRGGHMEKGNNGDITGNDEDDLDGKDEDEDDVEDEDEDGDEDEDNDDMGDEDEDDDEENQVVPRSSTPPPPVSSSSTTGVCSSNKFSNGDEDLFDSNLAFSMKRMRQTTKFHPQDHRVYLSSHQNKDKYL